MLIDIDTTTRKKWQNLVDSVSDLFQIPAVLIMHLEDPKIKVYTSSNSRGNPYKEGAGEHFDGSGLYCEWVVKNQKRLLVPNALTDVEWENNPDVKLNMISYLGFPVNYPDGSPFGTFCVLDNKENSYTPKVENLLLQIKGLIEDQLVLLAQRMKLIKTLHGIIPVCASCKNVRNSENKWISINDYIAQNSNALISDGLCPDCVKRLYPDMDLSAYLNDKPKE